MATRRIICAACRADSSPIASLCRRSLVTSTSTSTLFPKNPLRCKRNISSFDQSFLGAQNNYFSHGMCNTPNWSVQSEKRNYKKINAYLFEYSASRWMSSKDSSKKSPYNILQVKVNASKDEIKAAFRKLAKQHHPDMKIHKPQQQTINDRNENESDTIRDNRNEDNDDIMSELINSYEKLMNKHNDARWANLDNHARDSRVALACEMYTIEELRSVHNHWYDVYSFRVSFSDEGQEQNEDDEAEGVYDGFEVERGSDFDGNYADGGKNSQRMQQYSNQTSVTHTQEEDANSNNSNKNYHHLDPYPIIPLSAHPDDSISDMKREIQSKYGVSWGLEGRRVDRDGVYLGWELLYCGNGASGNDTAEDSERNGHVILSYHLFLLTYGIKEGDVLHAVVRRSE